MKLSDFLLGAGRPVAYYPKLRRITGSTNATIFLCQFVYWIGKEASGDGWIYKTSEEIEVETGLSYDEQKTARERLVKAGLMAERYARLEHKMYFRVDLDALNSKWATPDDGIPETGVAALAKADSEHSLIGTTEITTEITTIPSEKVPLKARIREPLSKEGFDWAIGKTKDASLHLDFKGLPEPFIPYAEVCVRVGGFKYKKNVAYDWLKTFSDWMEDGYQPSDVELAIKTIRKAGKVTIYRPGSITFQLSATAALRRSGRQIEATVETSDKPFYADAAEPPEKKP